METIHSSGSDMAAERLAAEVADVNASIELVASGAASRIILTGLRFGRAVAESLSAAAADAGVEIETSFWPEDDACDLEVKHAHG